jgi:hypothetical protein
MCVFFCLKEETKFFVIIYFKLFQKKRFKNKDSKIKSIDLKIKIGSVSNTSHNV